MNDIEKLYDMLMQDDIIESINDNINNLLIIIPELKYEMGFEHKHPHHHLDVWQHTLLALSMSERDFDVRLTLLLHDIGKPFSYQEEDGIRHFKGHPEVSKKIGKKILQRLGFNNLYIKKICYLISKHDEPITNKDIEKYPEITKKRYEIQRCDALAHNPEKLEKRKKYLELIKQKIM